MLVGQRIVNRGDGWHSAQDLIAHLVHGVLDASATVGGKCLDCDSPGTIPGRVKFWHHGLDMVESIKGLPCPSTVDFGAQDTVVHIRERRVLVADKVMEGRPSAFEDEKTGDRRTDGDALTFPSNGFDITRLCAITEKGVRMRLSVDCHPSPTMCNDLDVSGVDVFVCCDEVSGHDGSEEFRRRDGMLLRQDVNGVLHGVCCNDDTVIGLGISV